MFKISTEILFQTQSLRDKTQSPFPSGGALYDSTSALTHALQAFSTTASTCTDGNTHEIFSCVLFVHVCGFGPPIRLFFKKRDCIPCAFYSLTPLTRFPRFGLDTVEEDDQQSVWSPGWQSGHLSSRPIWGNAL